MKKIVLILLSIEIAQSPFTTRDLLAQKRSLTQKISDHRKFMIIAACFGIGAFLMYRSKQSRKKQLEEFKERRKQARERQQREQDENLEHLAGQALQKQEQEEKELKRKQLQEEVSERIDRATARVYELLGVSAQAEPWEKLNLRKDATEKEINARYKVLCDEWAPARCFHGRAIGLAATQFFTDAKNHWINVVKKHKRDEHKDEVKSCTHQ